MATWLGVIAETGGRADFWQVAKKLGVVPVVAEAPRYALIECEPGSWEAPASLAEELSRQLGTTCIGFTVQTTADVHELHAFRSGTSIRSLTYSRDGGGWQKVTGTPQAWERAYFFDDEGSTRPDDGRPWPDMLSDELSDEDVARYEAAKKSGDASGVLDLLEPSSTSSMQRVCVAFSIQGDAPAGRWKKPSLFGRLFGRSG
jgi:hypothetical protein